MVVCYVGLSEKSLGVKQQNYWNGEKDIWRKCVCSECIFSYPALKCPFSPGVLLSAGVREPEVQDWHSR